MDKGNFEIIHVIYQKWLDLELSFLKNYRVFVTYYNYITNNKKEDNGYEIFASGARLSEQGKYILQWVCA